MEERITGMMIYYHFVCKRKLWYFCHEINMENENEDVMLGKLLDENPDCLLVQLIDAQKLYAFPNRLQNLMVLFTACGFVALAFYMLSVRRTVARPINDLLWAFDRISEGRLQTRLEPSYT